MNNLSRRNALLGALIALLLVSGTAMAQSPQAATGYLSALQSSFREVSKTVLPAVVELNVTGVVNQQLPQFMSPFGQQRGGGGQRSIPVQGLGSGIIVRHTGNTYYVLTNNHVVDNATTISVRLSDQKEFKAAVVGKDSAKDLAMVSFTSTDNIPVAALGDSDTLGVGDIVLAVGNPFGYESTVTMGIVSALGRRGPPGEQISPYTSYIQTDAAINEGNSGGALVNIQGQVVGINTWIAGTTGGSVGLGFAIPINSAKSNIEDFITKGKVSYGWLGVQLTDIQDTTAYADFAKDLKVEGVKGAMILNVYKGSPAYEAGLLPGDYVTRVDTTDVQNTDNLTQVVGGLLSGKTYQFSLIRNGGKMNLQVKLGVRNDAGLAAQYKNLWPGATVIDITDQIRQQVSIPQSQKGVVVGYLPDSSTPAAIAGFQVGDVITDIGGTAVRNMADYFKALNNSNKRDLTFTIVRQGETITVNLTR
jgi:serine protease Do